MPLITASILSKKLAAGLDALVMDVKVGSGAFAGSLETAQALAESLVTVAGDAGLRTVAWLTDMNQALGHDVGNALEVARGDRLPDRAAPRGPAPRRRRRRWRGRCSSSAGSPGTTPRPPAPSRAPSPRAPRPSASRAWSWRSGGRPTSWSARSATCREAPVRLAVTPERAGIVTRVDARLLGLAVVALGGGRRRAEDAVDPAVGLADVAGPGDAVGRDRPLAVVHARSAADAESAAVMVRRAMTVAEAPPAATPSPVLQRIGPAP